MSCTCRKLKFVYNIRPLRTWHSECWASISQEKGMFPLEGRMHLVPFHYINPVSLHIPLSCFGKQKKNKKPKLLNPSESSRQMQSPSPTPPDMKTVTFTPALRSPPPQICEFFIFGLLRCLTSKPPCFPLKTFLFALYISALSPFCPLFFNMSIFSCLFYFIFSLPPFARICRSPSRPPSALARPILALRW